MRWPLLIVTVAAIGLLLGISITAGPPAVDRAAWEADLLELGRTVNDWPGLVESTRVLCTADGRDLDLLAAVAVDDGNDEIIRTGFEHVCPERLDDYDAAVDQVGGRR